MYVKLSYIVVVKLDSTDEQIRLLRVSCVHGHQTDYSADRRTKPLQSKKLKRYSKVFEVKIIRLLQFTHRSLTGKKLKLTTATTPLDSDWPQPVPALPLQTSRASSVIKQRTNYITLAGNNTKFTCPLM